MNHTPILDWPHLSIAMRADGGELIKGETTTRLDGASIDELRTAAIRHCAAVAETLGRPVRVTATDPDGEWPIIVHPDASVTEDTERTARPTKAKRRSVRRRTIPPGSAESETSTLGMEDESSRPPSDPRKKPAHHDDLGVPYPVESNPPHNAAVTSTNDTSRFWKQAIHSVNTDATTPRGGVRPRFRSFFRSTPRAGELSLTAPLKRQVHLAVLSLKGGVGKTTTSIGLGSTLAMHRDDRVITIDANPDQGTLGARVDLQNRHTVRDLNAAASGIDSYVQLRDFTNTTSSRLHVITGDTRATAQYDADAFKITAHLLSQYYDIVIADCGTGMSHSVTQAVLGLADQVILVLEPAHDAISSALATLDWLTENGHAHLAHGAVAVMSGLQRRSRKTVDVADVETRLMGRGASALIPVPYDHHLDAGGVIHRDQMATSTRNAYEQLAGHTVRRLTAVATAHPNAATTTASRPAASDQSGR